MNESKTYILMKFILIQDVFCYTFPLSSLSSSYIICIILLSIYLFNTGTPTDFVWSRQEMKQIFETMCLLI